MKRFAVAASLLLLSVACDEANPTVELAIETCGRLQEATTPIERRVTEEDLVASAETASEGLASATPAGPALADVLLEMSNRCPDQTRQLLGQDQATSDVRIAVDHCGTSEVSGVVINDGDATVNVRIEVRIIGDANTLLESAVTVVNGLEAGQRGKWATHHSVDDGNFTCNADVDRVTAH
jgi:hypothetical protein